MCHSDVSLNLIFQEIVKGYKQITESPKISELVFSTTMCDSGVSLTSCTEDAGLDTSDCDSPTGKGGHTVTIQVSSFIAKIQHRIRSKSTKGNFKPMLSLQVKVRTQKCKYLVTL